MVFVGNGKFKDGKDLDLTQSMWRCVKLRQTSIVESRNFSCRKSYKVGEDLEMIHDLVENAPGGSFEAYQKEKIRFLSKGSGLQDS